MIMLLVPVLLYLSLPCTWTYPYLLHTSFMRSYHQAFDIIYHFESRLS
jgi:hypothetical protein